CNGWVPSPAGVDRSRTCRLRSLGFFNRRSRGVTRRSHPRDARVTSKKGARGGNMVSPTLRTTGSPLTKVLPVGAEAELVALRGLRLEPEHRLVREVRERVGAPDAAPEVVARAEGKRLAVEQDLDLALEEEERLLEGVVVLLDGAAGDVPKRHQHERTCSELA